MASSDESALLSLWEKMVLEESRVEAGKRGLRVSDLEEEAQLSLALEESKQVDGNSFGLSAERNVDVHPNDHKLLNNAKLANNTKSSSGASFNRPATMTEEKTLYEDDDYLCEQQFTTSLSTSKLKPAATTVLDIISHQLLSPWQTGLPHDVAEKILQFLGDVDMCGYLNMVAKTNCFIPSESTYKFLCERTYPAQSRKKQLKVENWKSWRNMLLLRPRLRTNGFYCLRTLYSKAPSNDAFWEEKRFESVEVKFYRHMRFFDYGKVLYSLDTVEPDDMAKLLKSGTAVPRKIFEGRYTINKREVNVEVELHYATVFFRLQIMDGQDGYTGSHNVLRLIEHSSAALGAPVQWPNSRVYHQIPVNADLQFWRHWHWSSSSPGYDKHDDKDTGTVQ